MKIDVAAQAPTLLEIETERERLDKEISGSFSRRKELEKQLFWLGLLGLAGSVVFFCLRWEAGMLDEGSILSLLFGGALFFGSVGSLRRVWLVPVLIVIFGAGWAGVLGMLVSFFGGMGSITLVNFFFDKFSKKSSVMMNARALLNEAEERSCVEIKRWLSDPVITKYRDSVVSQGRKFVKTEVDAMRSYMAGAEDRRAVEDACRAVYGTVVPGV